MPDRTWYAPSLASPGEAGVQGWTREEIVQLLKSGVSAHRAVSGPMADVVYTSTQYLSAEDLAAMADYLADIPVREPEREEAARASSEVMDRGGRIYEQQCASCHGDSGQGVPSMYPALAGNRGITLGSHHNLVQIICKGGFAPATEANPSQLSQPISEFSAHLDSAQVTSLCSDVYANMISEIEVHYPGKFLTVLFKNPSMSKAIFDAATQGA